MKRSKYDRTVYGFNLEGRRKLSEKQYIEKIYNLNKERLETKISKFRDTSPISFDRSYRNSLAYFKNYVYATKKIYGLNIQEAMKEALTNRFADMSVVFADNAVNSLKDRYPDVYRQAIEAVGEELEGSRLTYDGSGNYTYRATNGSTIMIQFPDSSESQPTVFVLSGGAISETSI